MGRTRVEVWRSLEPAAQAAAGRRGSVVTIGVFDGVHRGHRAVVRHAADRARAAGLPLVVLTFDPHPMTVVRPGSAPPLVASVDHRARLLGKAGADEVLVLPFTLDRSQQVAEDFVREVLVEALRARVVVVGADFRFGHKAAGDLALLTELGGRHGFEVDAVGLLGDGTHGPRWSSTYVREHVAAGDVVRAAEALGHLFRVEGVVVEGDRRGRGLGYPTANVPVDDGMLAPGDGVYAGWLVRLDDPREQRLPAAVSVGTNPTFGGAQRRIEAYVLDRDDLDLYGVPVAVELVERIRAMERFDDVDALVDHMRRDVERARALLAR